MRIIDCDDLEFENTGAVSKDNGEYYWKIIDRGPKNTEATLVFITKNEDDFYDFTRTDAWLEEDGHDIHFNTFSHCFATRFEKEFKKGFEKKDRREFRLKMRKDFYASLRLAENLGREMDR